MSELAAFLGSTVTLVGVSDELGRSLARDERRAPTYAAEIGDTNADEPYRRKLSFVWHRLGQTLARKPGATEAADGLLADLDVIDRSLRGNRGAGSPTAALPPCGGGSSSSGSTSRSSTCGCTRRDLADCRRTRRTFAAIGQARKRHGAAALDTLIVSGTSSAADVVDAPARLADGERLSVVPLFETIEDLRAAPAILDELLADKRYARLIEARGRRVEVMVGYSDSGQGRRLSDRPVGDLPRAGGAGGAGASGAGSS